MISMNLKLIPKRKKIELTDVKIEWLGPELISDEIEKLSKHGEIENNRIEFEAKITSKNSTVQIHKKFTKVKSSPLRYFFERDRKEQEFAAKNAEFEEKNPESYFKERPQIKMQTFST